MWKILSFLGDLFADEAKHCFLGFLGGSLAYLLTSIILFASCWVLRRLTRKPIYLGVDWHTIILTLLLLFALVGISHALLDGFSTWYVEPLAPHLELIK